MGASVDDEVPVVEGEAAAEARGAFAYGVAGEVRADGGGEFRDGRRDAEAWPSGCGGRRGAAPEGVGGLSAGEVQGAAAGWGSSRGARGSLPVI